MKLFSSIISLCITTTLFSTEEITPYKYTDKEREKGLTYAIPQKSRFTTQRSEPNSPDIVYYLSTPHTAEFPIALLCGVSSSKNDLISIIHFHRYFLEEFLERGISVLTVEQRGINGEIINSKEFMKHYTRSERLRDHQTIIEHLKLYPPQGWNGKLILLGVSEGGPLVTTLTTQYSDITVATINWCGAGNWSWQDELWAFIKNMKKDIPWYITLRMSLPKWFPFAIDFYLPKTRTEYDGIMDQTLKNPDYTKEFMGMSYKYHADALQYPSYHYEKISTPLLVVAGDKDTIIDSTDEFVNKAQQAHAPITYLRIAGMDHYIRKYPEVVTQTFTWLEDQLK